MVGAPERTPSARLLAELREGDCSLAEYGLEISRRVKERFRAMSPAGNRHHDQLLKESEESLERQHWIETHDQMPFEDYLAAYYG
jgi:glutamate--cysteine ligase